MKLRGGFFSAPVLGVWLLLPAPVRGIETVPAATDTTDGELPTYRLPPFETTARRVRTRPSFPGARTVLDRKWLRRTDPIDLGRALLPVAGIRVLEGGDGMTSLISVRGTRPDRVAVLVDGQPLNLAQGGGVDLAPLDPETLDRVEIARGAMGALYGPYALGGAVNLVRRRNRDSGGGVRLTLGTQERARLRAGYTWRENRWSGDVSAQLATVSPRLGETRVRGQGGGGTARLAFHPGWASALETVVEHRRDVRDVPGSRHFPSPDARREDVFSRTELSARGVTAGALPGLWNLTLGGLAMRRSYEDPTHPLGSVRDHHENRNARAALAWSLPRETIRLETRVEGVHEALTSTTDGRRIRDRGAVAGHLTRVLGGWSLSGALRVDAIRGFDPQPSVRLGITQTLWRDESGQRWVSLRANGGTSFRPPTFDDLFWPARASAAGNPDLLPERALDLALGGELRLSTIWIQVSGFGSEIRDLIQWTPGADGVWRPHNVARARIQGVESEGSIGFGAFRLDGTATWLDAVDATNDPVTRGQQLVGRAPGHGFAELTWTGGRVDVAGGLRATSRVPVTAANTKWLDGYVLWHTRVRLQVTGSLRLDAEIRNLLDTPYEDLRGYATTGRELLVGFRLYPGGGRS